MKGKFLLADCAANILDDFVFYFKEHEQDIINGKDSGFEKVWLPVLRKQGVSFLNLTIGEEKGNQAIYGATDKYFFWDALKNLDMLLCEEENGGEHFIFCRSSKDIDKAIEMKKIAIIATLRGGKALEGKANYNTICNLRTLYRAGLRGLQLTGNNRNRLGDGFAQIITKGRLTNFGVEIVKEADRLGMVIDTSQLSDYGFFDIITQTQNPVIDSHTAMEELSSHPQNISRERVKAIGEKKGIVAISFKTALLANEKESATTEDLLRHIDYVVEQAGIEHVALGPDYTGNKTPVDREKIKGYANIGPVESNYQTPYQSEKYPGFSDGVWYGIRRNDYIEYPTCREEFSNIIDILQKYGYNDDDIRKISGENIIRVYKTVLK